MTTTDTTWPTYGDCQFAAGVAEPVFRRILDDLLATAERDQQRNTDLSEHVGDARWWFASCSRDQAATLRHVIRLYDERHVDRSALTGR